MSDTNDLTPEQRDGEKLPVLKRALDRVTAERDALREAAAKPRKSLYDLVSALLWYSWSDEHEDFKRMLEDGEDTEGHVFRVMVELDNRLTGRTVTPEELVRC